MVVTKCSVEIITFFTLWIRYKTEIETSKIPMNWSRSHNTSNFMAELEYHMNRRRQVQEKVEQDTIKLSMELKPFRIIPAELEWVKMVVQGSGKMTRFPFLALDGPSMYGKTRFAEPLFGPDHTLTLSC
jgi:hypothetical protein